MASHTAPPNSNLPLPPELRDKIFTELLVHPEQCEHCLTFNPANHKIISSWYEEDEAYARQFSAISQVSKAMREEAQKIFFGRNEWFLELRLAREIKRERPPEDHPMRWKTVFGEVMGVDTPALIKETWGEEALGLMRKVQLYINGRDFDIETTVKDKLKDLVRIFREGNNLKQLSVNWQNSYTFPKFSGPCGTPMVKESAKIRRSSRKEDGTREQPIQHKNWPKEEMILEPLKELRGLEQTLVFGSVGDQWAIWLEQRMKSDEANLPDFERIEGFPDVVKSGN